MIDSIFEHAAQCAPRECCGLVIQDGNDKRYIPMENISENENEFEMNPLAFATIQAISKILYVVHSHYDEDCHPSEHDINNCNEIGIPYFIVSYPDKDYTILEPK
jgi:proteasome lid subunit RPN8/RPN11